MTRQRGHVHFDFVLWLLAWICVAFFAAGAALLWAGHQLWTGAWRAPDWVLSGAAFALGAVLTLSGGWGLWSVWRFVR